VVSVRKLIIAASVAALTALGGGTALAANPQTMGQPNQTCLSNTAPMEPGQSAAAPGSAFNEDPGGVAGSVYAGEDDTHSLNANSDKAVSQYDVACFQVSR
jgi:hypothetical protein